MDFELAPGAGNVAFLQRTPARATPPPADAAAWFSRGEALEASDRRAAEAAYRRVLAIDPGHADAYLNLGALLCESRRFDEAVALYDEALKQEAARSAASLQPRHRARGPRRRGGSARQLPRLPAPGARPRRRALQRGPPAPAARRRAPGGAPLQRLPATAAAALTSAAGTGATTRRSAPVAWPDSRCAGAGAAVSSRFLSVGAVVLHVPALRALADRRARASPTGSSSRRCASTRRARARRATGT